MFATAFVDGVAAGYIGAYISNGRHTKHLPYFGQAFLSYGCCASPARRRAFRDSAHERSIPSLAPLGRKRLRRPSNP